MHLLYTTMYWSAPTSSLALRLCWPGRARRSSTEGGSAKGWLQLEMVVSHPPIGQPSRLSSTYAQTSRISLKNWGLWIKAPCAAKADSSNVRKTLVCTVREALDVLHAKRFAVQETCPCIAARCSPTHLRQGDACDDNSDLGLLGVPSTAVPSSEHALLTAIFTRKSSMHL